MKKIILVLITLLMLSCKTNNFSLTGSTNLIEDGTFLYLEDVTNGVILDSVKLQHQTFTFKPKLPKTPYKVWLRTKTSRHYRPIWLENNKMFFKDSIVNFKTAEIVGSKTEELNQKRHKKIDYLSYKQRLQKNIEFVQNHPNSVVSAHVLSVYSSTWGKQNTQELYEKFSRKNKKSIYGKKIKKFLDLNKEPKIGDEFVDFEMKDLSGKKINLSDIKGKTILLEFWASGCFPCRFENPSLLKTYKEFNSKGFEIFAVSLDIKKSAWKDAIESDKLPWINVSELNGSSNSAALIYGVKAMPTNFLISTKGIIIEKNLRGETLNNKLKEILE